ncbi:rhomboid family intramembrane serine protease [Akkermansiaceae bacterium]|nr:rhomboid family intramembrane serine protease [Akkermansiaceae bacterium]
MFLLIPYEIETLRQERPWANWILVGLSTLVSLAAIFGVISEEAIDRMVLWGWNPAGLIGHIFLHGGFIHLIGNMIFLWVFGNAVCTNIGNLRYLAAFFGCTLIAAAAHNLFDGGPAIGASGAINGVVGMVLAMYPLNRIHVWWLFLIKGGTFAVKAWIIIVFWLLFDVWGVATGGSMIAYWAHIGGLAGGVAIGLTGLHLGWIELTRYDNRSLLDIFTGKGAEEIF